MLTYLKGFTAGICVASFIILTCETYFLMKDSESDESFNKPMKHNRDTIKKHKI